MNIKSSKEFKAVAAAYFNACQADGRPPTVAGLALSLGAGREELLKSREGPMGAAVRLALTQCEAFAEERLLEGKNVTGVIFSLKNNFGWQERAAAGTGENSFEIIVKHPWEQSGDNDTGGEPPLAALHAGRARQ